MIDVICDQTGDRAEAADEESACVAARTMCGDATDAGVSEKLTCSFFVGGRFVRKGVYGTDF